MTAVVTIRIRRSFAECERDFLAWAVRDSVVVIGKYTGANNPVHCKCSFGHDCYPRPNDIRMGRGWCLVCAGHDPAEAERCFRECAIRDRVQIIGEYVKSNEPVFCICSEGHFCSPRPSSIKQGQGWCKVCAGNDPVVSERNFLERAACEGVTLVGKYIKSKEPVHCICPVGHDCYPIPQSVRQGWGWCKTCLIQMDRIYLMCGKFENIWWAKVGISSRDYRVKEHLRNGWVEYFQWRDLNHGLAWSVEASIKGILREGKWATIAPEFMPQRGFSETFPIEYVTHVESMIEYYLNEFAA